MTPAELLRAWRTRHGLSRAEFARRLGAPLRTVENWESDKSIHRDPPLYLLRLALCELERRMYEEGREES